MAHSVLVLPCGRPRSLAVAFAVADGAEKDQSKLKDYVRPHALPKMPSLLEYFGHSFFFPSVMVGPNHHYSIYRDLIEGTGPHEKPASGLAVGLKKLGLAGAATSTLCRGHFSCIMSPCPPHTRRELYSA